MTVLWLAPIAYNLESANHGPNGKKPNNLSTNDTHVEPLLCAHVSDAAENSVR